MDLMSGNGWHLKDPAFCTPLPVMRELVSALCERREAVDSEFHASCTSSGTSAVVENLLAHFLTGEWYDNADSREIPFRIIRKEYAYDEFWGYSRYLSFAHMFDAFLVQTLLSFSEVMGYGARQFADSAGSAYGSLENLASALSEHLTAPRTILNGNAPDAVASEGRHGYGASPQEAYDAIPSWTLVDTGFAGWETPLECRTVYWHTESDNPNERWTVHSAWEVARITPDHQGCPAASGGMLRFDAVDLQERDENGNPEEDEFNTYVFDPLCTSVSSGSNTLVLSNGVFASWGYGEASGVGGPATEPGDYIRGWQARNVSVIYDYDSNFEFKQGE